MIGSMALLLTNCASNTYKIKKEKDKQVLKVPSWYMNDYSTLAIEKAMLISKAEVADKVKGEMNKKAKIFTTELGKNVQKTVVTDVETTLVNIIKNTPVRGYEVWKQEVTLTQNGYYRAWIGIKLPMGEYNKMYNYSVETVVDAFKLKEIAQKAYDEVEIIANEQ